MFTLQVLRDKLLADQPAILVSLRLNGKFVGEEVFRDVRILGQSRLRQDLMSAAVETDGPLMGDGKLIHKSSFTKPRKVVCCNGG